MGKQRESILGPPPWSESLLREAYFRDFISTQKAIQEHPGFPAHRDLCAHRLSMDVFLCSVTDLLKSIDSFHMDAESPDFWSKPAADRFGQRELTVRKEVFAATSSALALVDCARNLKKKIASSDYEQQRRDLFDDHEHRLIQGLRNYVCHSRMVEVDWQRSFLASGKRTQFLLKPETLFEWNGWNKDAKAFILRHPDGIDVAILFADYRTRVTRFHGWLQMEFSKASEPNLSLYRGYERMLKGFGSKSWWNILLERAIQMRIDPFTYLGRYLSKDELNDVLALPSRSPRQVDRIIELIDEYGVCDEQMKRKVYQVFAVKP